MTEHERLVYEKAVKEYGPEHSKAVWGFLGAYGALHEGYGGQERLEIAVKILEQAFEYERRDR